MAALRTVTGFQLVKAPASVFLLIHGIPDISVHIRRGAVCHDPTCGFYEAVKGFHLDKAAKSATFFILDVSAYIRRGAVCPDPTFGCYESWQGISSG